jgi:beta-mannosidase
MGVNSLPALRSCFSNDNQAVIDSLEWQVHDCGAERFFKKFTVDAMFEDWLGIDPRSLSLEAFVQYAGILQGEGLKEYAESFRSKKWDCASAIFWMYNDCWPTARSWTVVDYLLNRCPAFYFVRRAFAPVHLVLREDPDAFILMGINDTLETWSGLLDYGAFTCEGSYLLEECSEVVLKANAITTLARIPISTVAADALPFAELRRKPGEPVISRNRRFRKPFKHLPMPHPQIAVERRGNHLAFSSDCFAWNVRLDLSGELFLEDNFFDLYPNREYLIPWDANRPLPEIKPSRPGTP